MTLKRFALLSSTLATFAFAALAISVLANPAASHAHAAPSISRPAVSGPRIFKIFHGVKSSPQIQSSNNLYMWYTDSPVETTPVVYISWWGSWWNSSHTTTHSNRLTNQQFKKYMTDFYSHVGGSNWDGINTQYCDNVAAGTQSCSGVGSQYHVGNPTGQLGGTWTDTASVPSRPTQSQIASAATRLMQHFGYNHNATYFVFTPSGHSMSGFNTQWCAWHDSTSTGSGTIAYSYMPYITDAGVNCGENFVNGSNDSYGHGTFDGLSIVGGHEYAEALTDPNPEGTTLAWLDSSQSEIGDKCAWSALSNNLDLSNGNHYAVQPLWSGVTQLTSSLAWLD
jgi:serine protease